MRQSIVPAVLEQLPVDGWLLFATRFIRLFAYGSLSVVLVFYLIGLGLSERETGTLLTLTLVGDTVISLYLTTRADRMGRRRALVVGAALMVAAGIVFASARAFWLLVLAGTVGVISPSGNEVGPFLSIEQAALAQVATDRTRTEVLAWYTFVGSLATALGALAAGIATRGLQGTAPGGYRAVVILYAVLGLTLAALFSGLSRSAEAPGKVEGARPTLATLSGLDRSRDVVVKLAALFSLDSFAGGFVIQSFAAYWFYLRFGANPALVGPIFFWANIFAGLSALLASRMAARFGLVRTMVATHLPSNVLLILIPLMPRLWMAVLVLLARFSISQMDVPTRQSYLMAVVSPEERSAAAGIAGVARTIGAAISPLFVGFMFARPALINLPFFIAGTLKIAYDLLLYRAFVAVKPPEERQREHLVPSNATAATRSPTARLLAAHVGNKEGDDEDRHTQQADDNAGRQQDDRGGHPKPDDHQQESNDQGNRPGEHASGKIGDLMSRP
jgi:MFS family permease